MTRRLAALALAAAALGCSKSAGKKVHVFTWDAYDDPAVFEEFERATGVRVVADRFASNEELLAKLMGGGGGYDVIVPSDYMVSIMVRQGLLTELDKAKLGNLSHIDPAFLGLYYDPGNRYCVPYLLGFSGIGYDGESVKPAPESWSVFWDPAHKGRMSLLNDQREVFAMGLQRLGYPANTRDPAVLEKVQKSLLEQKKLIKTYSSENPELLLVSGEVRVAHLWSGDINRVAHERPALRFILPKEGGFIWQDNLCVPKGAPNKEEAQALINFLLEPRNAARIVQKTHFGCPNRSAWDLLPKEFKDNPTIVPAPGMLKRLEWIHDVGEAGPLYDRLWTELKAS